MEMTSENEEQGLCLMKLWVARDKDGELFLYNAEPILNKTFKDRFEIYGSVGNGALKRVSKIMFPSVTFENSPQEVELKLINNGNQD